MLTEVDSNEQNLTEVDSNEQMLTEVDSYELVFVQQFLQHSPVHLFYLVLSLKIIIFRYIKCNEMFKCFLKDCSARWFFTISSYMDIK